MTLCHWPRYFMVPMPMIWYVSSIYGYIIDNVYIAYGVHGIGIIMHHQLIQLHYLNKCINSLIMSRSPKNQKSWPVQDALEGKNPSEMSWLGKRKLVSRSLSEILEAAMELIFE